MSSAALQIDHWPAVLEAVLPHCAGLFDRVTVLAETDSTQDAARRGGATAGSIIVTGRQTTGRGRLGRPWADPAGEGVAATFVIARTQPERLSIASAIGAVFAIESFLHHVVGIKWPNDILVDGRKLAGVLVEQVDDVALIGIGINVEQRSWPPDLADKAVSLAQLGGAADRLVVLRALLPALTRALRLNEAALAAEFARRDLLLGRTATFSSAGLVITGRIARIEPMRGLLVVSGTVERWLSAATTTLIELVDSSTFSEASPVPS